VSADAFRESEEKKPAGLQRIVERAEDAILQVAVQVDHEVPARDEIELRERRILRYVVN